MRKKENLSSLPGEMKGALARTDQPAWIQPMLATLTDKRFFKEGWVYEPKLDGVRCLAFKQGGEVRLFTRNRNSLNDRHPGIAEALLKQPAEEFVLDGEVVAFAGERSNFAFLQKGREGVEVCYYVFDILHFEGYDLTRMPLAGRKALLEQALIFDGPVRFLSPIAGADEDFFKETCDQGWEGLIAKREDSLYVSRRSADWLKFKCIIRQEFVIGGYTEPGGARTGFGSLLLGYYEGESLRYAGRVGTGFNERTLSELYRQLSHAERPRSPFTDDVDGRGVHWVEPELVAEIGFSEWTEAGRLRHPRFVGLRDDPDRE